MSEIPNLIGHDDPWQQWRSAMAGPRMHHGWLLAGRRGIGKASFAEAAARILVAEEGVTQPKGAHPDIITLINLPSSADEEKKRDKGDVFQTKRNITVDQIRAMQKRLNTRPTLGSKRVIIIDPADNLEKGASNALLKSLEEPPEGSFFMLIAHRPGRLLPTIRSRCRILQFPKLEDAQVNGILMEHAPEADGATRDAAIAACSGSPGAALEFVELDLGKMHVIMMQIAQQGDPGFVLRGRLASAMGARPVRKKQLAVVDLARAVVSAKMRGISIDAIPALADAHTELSTLAAQVPTHNFDPGLLVMEIGTLLTTLARTREPANG